MFNKTCDFIRKNKYTLLGGGVILTFSLFSFIWLIATGEHFDISENKSLLFGLFVFRCLIYIALFVLIEKRVKGKGNVFFGRLLACIIFIYEAFVVFNVPELLLKQFGG